MASRPDYGMPLDVHPGGTGDAGYSFGFLEAADALLEHAKTEPLGWPLYTFPIAALYRHALELQLKELVRDAREAVHMILRHEPSRLDDQQRKRAKGLLASNPPLKGHNLDSLLAHATECLRFIQAEEMPAVVRETVATFHSFDPTNEAFRYAHKHDGATPTIPRNATPLDLRVIGPAVRETYEALGKGCDWAIITADQIREFLDDY